MAEIAQLELQSALDVARTASVQQAPNGVCYASFGQTQVAPADLDRMVQAVPRAIAAALTRKAYYFVPLTLAESEDSKVTGIDDRASDQSEARASDRGTLIAPDYTTDLSDRAICHRNVSFNGADCVFISTRLMQDRFALAFEFYINVGHHFVDFAGVPESFSALAWSQAEARVRGETSQDAWEHRAKALEPGRPIDEKARSDYFDAAFSDAIAIYLLSLTVDFDYTELREREYPLLAAPSLAERLRHIAQLFPSNDGQEFTIRYRRRGA